jgi:outer membrane protein assembly factor BamB
MKKILKILVTTLFAVLMLTSCFALFAIAQPTSTATTNEDIMQYDWPEGGYNEGNTGYNLGPAPDTPNVRWKAATQGSGMVSVFNGKAYVITGSVIGSTLGTNVQAFDAMTGQSLWIAQTPLAMKGVCGIYKLDENYLLGYDVGFLTAIKIADGTVAWTVNITGGSGLPGTGSYFAGHYSESMKMFFTPAWDGTKNEAQILGYDLSNPSTAPTVAWIYRSDSPIELLCSGDGKVFAGSTEATVVAINGKTGERVWESSTRGGLVQQSAIYTDGNLYTSAVNWQLTCFDGATGQIKWQTDKGTRAFSAYRGAAGMGMIFDATVELDPHGTIRAWDATTGEELWRQPAYFNIHYATMACADGKLYSSTCDQAAGAQTGGLLMPGYETACFDAYTGTQLWKLKGINFAHISIAYGNVYGIANGYVYCIGGDPADWSNGLQGNVGTGRVAVGQSGPADISTPKWVYQTGGDVSSSPAVVDGKLYVGSHDKNWYCLNAYTGEKIWNFTIGSFVRTSAAVADGKVFTGADDGYFYALNANTGQQIWKTPAGGQFPYMFTAIEYQSRSSPIVVGAKVYCGSLDGKVYCLNAADGTVLNTYDTKSPIFGSPAYSDGTIYIASTDFTLYALSASDLSLKWKSISLTMDIAVPERSKFSVDATPAIGGGLVFIGAGVYSGTPKPGANYTGQSVPRTGGFGGAMRMMAFNATTGESVMNQTRSGNTPIHVPVYFNGQIYGPEFFYLTSMNASNPNSGTAALGDFGASPSTPRLSGNRTWAQWLGYQISSSAAYADDITGAKIYIGSDIGSLYAMDATTGKTLSVFTAGANIPSSPAIWDGKLYACAINGKIFCFDNTPSVDFSIQADSNKGGEMFNTETVTISGRLSANPMELVWQDGVYVPVASNSHPGLPDATVKLSLTRPDGTDVPLTTTTNQSGYFTFSYNPTQTGTWGWTVYYDGQISEGLTYNQAFSTYNNLNVIAASGSSAPPASSQPTSTNTVIPNAGQTSTTQSGLAVEYIYAIIIVVVLVIVVAGAYLYTKRRK